jgi:hypothetical protein
MIKYEELSANTVAFISYRLKALHTSSFLQAVSATRMSTDVSQVGVTVFPLSNIFYHFYLSMFSFFINTNGKIVNENQGKYNISVITVYVLALFLLNYITVIMVIFHLDDNTKFGGRSQAAFGNISKHHL